MFPSLCSPQRVLASLPCLSLGGELPPTPSYIIPQSFPLSLSPSHMVVSTSPPAFSLAAADFSIERVVKPAASEFRSRDFPSGFSLKGRAREGGEKARASVRERGRGRERIRGLVTDSWVQAVYMQLKRIPRRKVRETLFFCFFTVTVFGLFCLMVYCNALNRLSGEHNDN